MEGRPQGGGVSIPMAVKVYYALKLAIYIHPSNNFFPTPLYSEFLLLN